MPNNELIEAAKAVLHWFEDAGLEFYGEDAIAYETIKHQLNTAYIGAAAIARSASRAGKAGTGAAKRRGDSSYYRELRKRRTPKRER